MSDENTIAYPEWTKKGYREAHEGDGLVMMRPHHARGTVQPQQCPTIMTGQGGGCGVVVRDDREPTIPIKEDTEQGYADADEQRSQWRVNGLLELQKRPERGYV